MGNDAFSLDNSAGVRVETSEVLLTSLSGGLIVPKSNAGVTESIRFIDSASIEDVRKNSALAIR